MKRRRPGVNLIAQRKLGTAKAAPDASSIADRPRAGVPDFRSIGLLLRLMGLVIAGVLFVSVARVPLAEVPAEFVRIMAATIPVLFICVALLAAGARWLTRWPLSWVIGLSLVLVALVTLLQGELNRAGSPEAILLALGAAAALWGYLAMETQAKSPAFDIARLQALQARIRPHFLFNSLNAVVSLMRSQPGKAENALLDLADLYRALMRDNRELTLLSEEVTLASQYLTLEKLRLNERLRVKWYIDNMPRDALVPPLVLQPLLENAVYHGIEPSPKGGDVAINIFCRHDHLTILVSNPFLGTGNQRRSRGNNMAVGNIRERLKLHFDVEGSMQQVVHGDVYEVRVTMPYRRASSVPTMTHLDLP
jgi:two-component system, LytTR family, sensor histidine kinase AlgZ